MHGTSKTEHDTGPDHRRPRPGRLTREEPRSPIDGLTLQTSTTTIISKWMTLCGRQGSGTRYHQCFPQPLWPRYVTGTMRTTDLLTTNRSSQSESKTFHFLQQYVRSQNPEALVKLLHFPTGIDAMCVSKIYVEFTQTVGLGRRPIAHTCGPLLQLPATYSAYRELRQEFDGILQGHSGFTMNIRQVSQ